jgi:hypothetical protein
MRQSYKELVKEQFDHIAKIIELINVIGWDDDGTYTFEDGERWARFEPDTEDTNPVTGTVKLKEYTDG